jgi:hypothetical protein
MTSHRLPDPEDLRTLFRDLLEVPSSVGKRSVAPLPAGELVTARYINDGDVLVAACVADLELAVAAGSALGLVGAPMAADALRRGEIRGALFDHYYEVVNVISSLLNGPTRPHLRLADVVHGVPDDVAGLAHRGSQRHYTVGLGPSAGRLLALIAA